MQQNVKEKHAGKSDTSVSSLECEIDYHIEGSDGIPVVEPVSLREKY